MSLRVLFDIFQLTQCMVIFSQVVLLPYTPLLGSFLEVTLPLLFVAWRFLFWLLVGILGVLSSYLQILE